jgi:uncharacterized phage protein gp47/JayE
MSDERPFLKKTFAGIVDDALTTLRSGHGGRVVLDDATEGSVLRTLVEAFARELAVCYEQLEAVYEAGYLDTAEGPALERVVELLGVERHQAGWLEGDVVFGRATPAPFDIDIPAGTLVAGKGVQAFETLAQATLALGQTEVRVPVRSLVPEGKAVDPGKLSVLNRPIPGIERVTNPGALLPRRDPETDQDLRGRARSAVRGGRTATIAALEQAVRAIGIVDVQVVEDPALPGRVDVVLADLDINQTEEAEARRRVEEVRPAGVWVSVYRATPIWIRVRATLVLDAELSVQAASVLRAELRTELAAYFDSLGINETVRWNKIRNLLAAHPRAAEIALPRTAGGQPDWPLVPVDPATGEPLVEDEDAIQRLLGSVESPVGVFIGADERARLHAVELELQPPALLVWIDVEAVYTGLEADKPVAEAAIRALFADIFPPEPLSAPVPVVWDTLASRLETELDGSGVAGVDRASLRFVILHDRDGRVVTLAEDPAASESDILAVREVVDVRDIRLNPPEES